MSVIGTLKSWVAGNRLKASDLNANFSDIKTSVNAVYTIIGALASLTTIVKTSLVNAINELVTALTTKIEADGSIDFTAIQSYGSDISGDLTAGSNEIPNVKYVDDSVSAVQSGFKEYGLELSHSGGNVAVSSGKCYASDNSTKLEYAGSTYSVTGSSNSTMYYLFLGLNISGDEVLEKDTNSDGSGLSTITGAKICIGRYYYGTGAIDTTKLWQKHFDGSETYIYEQASGNFPNADITISHNLGTSLVDLLAWAKDGSNVLYPLGAYNGYNSLDRLFYRITDTNTIVIDYENVFYITSTGTDITNSASYKLKLAVRSFK